jgi:hypothetical protein
MRNVQSSIRERLPIRDNTAIITEKPNYNHVVEELQDYMLDARLLSKSFAPKNITTYEYESENGKKTIKEEKQMKKEPERFFFPNEKDQLFWCYYILQHGFAKYEYPGTSTFVNEKTEKFKCIDMMRSNKQQLKIKKIKNIKEDVEDELANKQTIGMKTFIALCITSNINIMYIHKRKCFEIVFDDSQPVHVVHCIQNSDSSREKYCYEMNATKEQVELYRTTLFPWESVDKPLKAISSYKLDELQKIGESLGFDKDSMKQKTKKEIYESIIMNL